MIFIKFLCTRCDFRFQASVGEYEAPMCSKCRDSEFVIRASTYHSDGGYYD